jgi:hypothetical protein
LARWSNFEVVVEIEVSVLLTVNVADATGDRVT